MAPKLRKKSRAGRVGRVFLKFLVIGMAFAAFLIWGLTIAEDSVNHLMGRAADREVFHIGESPEGQLELILLGERYLIRLRPTPAGESEGVLK